MEPIQLSSLDDLADVVVDVPIRRPDGRTVIVPMRALPEAEIFALRTAVVWPKPPPSGATKAGIIYDYNAESYVSALRDANRQLTYRVMLRSLRLVVFGANEDEQLATLMARLGNYAFVQMVEASNSLNVVSEEDLAALARSFRPGPAPSAAGDDAPAVGAGPVVGAAQG